MTVFSKAQAPTTVLSGAVETGARPRNRALTWINRTNAERSLSVLSPLFLQTRAAESPHYLGRAACSSRDA